MWTAARLLVKNSVSHLRLFLVVVSSIPKINSERHPKKSKESSPFSDKSKGCELRKIPRLISEDGERWNGKQEQPFILTERGPASYLTYRSQANSR